MRLRSGKQFPLEESTNTFIPDENPIVSFCSQGAPYSYYQDDLWVFVDRDSQVKFHRLHGGFKDAIKQIIYRVVIDKKLILSKYTYSHNWIEAAIFFQKMIQHLGGESFRFVDSDSGLRQIISYGKTLKIKYKTWKNNLILLSKLYENGLIERRIENSDILARELSSLSGVTQQSMAIPEKIAAKYIKSSIDVVDRFYPHRFDISKAYGEFVENFQELQKHYRHRTTPLKKARKMTLHDIPHEDFSLDLSGAWLSWLRGACYTLIASFTGSRDGEIKSFNLDSYVEETYGDVVISIVSGGHTKPNVGGVKRETSWVTNQKTKEAIELLWCSFEFAREIWKEDAESIIHMDLRKKFLEDINSLFILLPYIASVRPFAGRQSISNSLTSFAKSVGYSASHSDVEEFNVLNPTRKGELAQGQVLIPHPHGFRRTFAVFLVRNKLGSLLDLKYQFKHINIAMTAWYSNQANIAAHLDMTMDAELMDLIAEENHSFMTDTLYYIYNEASTLSGKEGDRIMSARRGVDASIYLSREEISTQVKNGQMSITENPFGHCTNPTCSRICDMQTCRYKIVTKEKALSLLPVREQLVAKFNALRDWNVNQPNIMSKIYFDIKSIDKSLDDHNIDYSPFSENLTASMLQRK